MPPQALAERGLNIVRWTVMPRADILLRWSSQNCLRRICESSSVHCDRLRRHQIQSGGFVFQEPRFSQLKEDELRLRSCKQENRFCGKRRVR